MSGQYSDKAPATFCDVAASFSIEEWRLLHDWQKELYKNVMKEIQKALISLGPLIAASVFSLSTEEKEVIGTVDSAGSEACDRVHQHSGDVHFASHLPSEITRDQTHYLQERLDTCRWESNNSTSRVENEGIAPILSFTIKQEADTECLDRLDFQERERLMNSEDLDACYVDDFGVEGDDSSTSITTGNHDDGSLISQNHKPQKIAHWQEEYEYARMTPESGRMSRIKEDGNNLKYNFIQPSGTSQGMEHLCELQSREKRINTGSQLQSKVNPQLDGENIMQRESGFGEPTYSVFYQGIPNVAISAECNESENSFGNAKLLSCQQSTNPIKRWHVCTECEKGFSKRSNLLRHQRTHMERKLYQCSACEKSFSLKGHLILHQRAHTEDRLYHCSVCKLNFSQHEHLVAHQLTHERERPYECTECEKRFTHKFSLTLHERTHTGEKPYQCNVCGKSFSQKGNLIIHKRTHTGDKPFQCSKCKKSFCQKVNLIRHENAHVRCDQKRSNMNPYMKSTELETIQLTTEC